MRRILVILLAATLPGWLPAWGQEPTAPPPSTEQPPAERPAQAQAPAEPAKDQQAEKAGQPDDKPGDKADPSGAPDVNEKTVLDDQTFEGEDDEFIPTEEIPLSEPIPFPVDI